MRGCVAPDASSGVLRSAMPRAGDHREFSGETERQPPLRLTRGELVASLGADEASAPTQRIRRTDE
jgi:hypothetical protein